VIDARDVRVQFGKGDDALQAVNGVSLEIGHGEIVGLVGESGSGKTTLARAIAGLQATAGGEVHVEGQAIAGMGGGDLRRLRRRVQVIFQDPHASLSPRLRVGYLLREPYTIHGVAKDGRMSAEDLLDTVGLAPEIADKYAHELSGGQARRVGIARALALAPTVLVADEPTAGLDVSTAAGVLNLIADLRDSHGLTMLLITHDLNVVGAVADRIGVMYLGELVELAGADALFEAPRHPYTRALLGAIPVPDPTRRTAACPLAGEVPSPRNPPTGCRFHTRCPVVRPERCATEKPPLAETDTGLAACHWWQELAARER
jgi:oligopeptide/dipeptide ABC transporter ATP-binding protein